MFEYVQAELREIERSVRRPEPEHILSQLRRRLGLDDFAELMFAMPAGAFPKISAALPQMASAEIQNAWTGTIDFPLLRQSANFIRSAAYNFTKLTGKPLDGASLLDYGCGYGRLARLMYYFVDPERLYGVDPWDRSIEICHQCGLGGNFRQSDYLPETLPLPPLNFDFIYAFSVFTHLSHRAAAAALNVCRRYMADDGVLLITIRPVEYWALPPDIHGVKDTSGLVAEHNKRGFAFSPHKRPAVDGDITYGDTSMTTAWIEATFPRWRVATVDRSLDDAYQIYVFLQPR